MRPDDHIRGCPRVAGKIRRPRAQGMNSRRHIGPRRRIRGLAVAAQQLVVGIEIHARHAATGCRCGGRQRQVGPLRHHVAIGRCRQLYIDPPRAL